MIQNDTELQEAQERILRFERFLAEARKTEPASNYAAIAEGYLSEIHKMQAEIREYSSRVSERAETAGRRMMGKRLPCKRL